MRNRTILMTCLALGACGGGNKAADNLAGNATAPANIAVPAANAAAPSANAAAPVAAAGLPADFPGDDLAARGAECVVYLGLAQQAGARPAGRDAPIMEQAAGQWRSVLAIDGHMSV